MISATGGKLIKEKLCRILIRVYGKGVYGRGFMLFRTTMLDLDTKLFRNLIDEVDDNLYRNLRLSFNCKVFVIHGRAPTVAVGFEFMCDYGIRMSKVM